MATLTVSTSTDFRGGAAETSIDEIEFTASAGAIFGSDQFGAGLISNSVLITGNNTPNSLSVFLSVAGAFSAAGWTFATWSSDSIVSIEGTSGVDTITGSAQVDFIVGGAGADILDGGAGNDIF
jgi:Ca2+-binding RTX toxin-like protein